MSHRASYWKTTSMALAAAGVSAAAMGWTVAAAPTSLLAMTLAASEALVLAASALVAMGGLVCLWRDARLSAGKADVLTTATNRVPGPGVLERIGLRFLLGSAPRPGDLVRVRTSDEIAATLDADGTLEGLPFMPEMRACCGHVFRVHRRIDKINDMRHKTGVRRMERAVTLTGVRCSGNEHDGCQAGCLTLWKDAWLQRIPAHSDVVAQACAPAGSAASAGHAAADAPYMCQMTRLWEASRPMSRYDLRQDLRPLLSGNVGLGPWVIALLTRLFNAVQSLRRGTGFPAMPAATGAAMPAALPLRDGAAVRVRSRSEIAMTLRNSRHKGLWFDPDMVRFCGMPGTVGAHVDRVIHESTGKMVVMKSPCIVLDGVVATGEFLRLCPQHEYIFWREAWLAPASGDADPVPAFSPSPTT
jgi:hypothetical protein